jgi:hypothetical protein
MESLGTLVPKVYPAQQPEEARAMRLFGAWSKVVPERILLNARPVSFQHGILTVHTTTASWANALSFETVRIIAKLRQRLNDVPVERIAFRMGRLPDMPDLIKERSAPPRLCPVSELPEAVARELARITHDGLRESVTRAIITSLATVEPVRVAKRERPY